MTAALAAMVTVAFLVVGLAGAAWGLHLVLRPTEMTARSATALRALEPRGGRQRFPARFFEVTALATASAVGLGVFFSVAASPDTGMATGLVGGGAMLVAAWWAWRRGALRSVEAEARPAPTGPHEPAGGSRG
ncbi:MAG: hypothetical protein IT382_00410 [Deltaproteobacteria bacterium]|nr:hypothetical protein [Deltaproteobacteria bacterium]